MATFREIIVEAFCRSNLNPRKRELPSDMFTEGANLLKGILKEYQNNGFLVAYQNDLDFVPNKTRYVVGNDTDNADLVIENIEKPYRVFYRPNGAIDWVPLFFVAYNQFFTCGNGDYVISWKPLKDGVWEIIFKDRFIPMNNQCKIVYNMKMDFKDDDVISLPDQYIELLTRALAYKLTIVFPRVDETKKLGLKEDLTVIEEQIKSDNANQRIITRSSPYGFSKYGNFMGGSFISDTWY